MGMRPSISGRLSLGQEFSKTIQEILAILIVEEYLATLYHSDNGCKTPGAQRPLLQVCVLETGRFLHTQIIS